MSMAQKQQLFELLCKARLVKGKEIQCSIKKLEARVAIFQKKQIMVATTAYFQTKGPKAVIGRIQPCTEREMVPDRADQAVDG